MKFKILLLSFIATGCYANESTADPDICNIVKKVAYNVMEARQQKSTSTRFTTNCRWASR